MPSSHTAAESPGGVVDAGVRAVYVHSPYCVRRCTYCDFAISLFRDRVPPARFLNALALEVGRLPVRLAPRTLFIGGGTPTALKPADLDLFFDILARGIAPTRLIELSIESNPENLRDDRIDVLCSHGVTRVSLGAQSFDPDSLAVLGRNHSADQTRDAVERLRKAGIPRINVDLIFGLPGQTAERLDRDLDALLSLKCDHVSAYSLTYEQDTEITRGREQGLFKALDDLTELAFYRQVRERLEGSGFRRYEVSNFARPAARCLHNLAYWRNRPYLGLGPSAVSYIDGVRWKNEPDLERWCALLESGDDPVVEREALSTERSLRETVMVGLRREAGVRRLALERRYGSGFELLDQEVLARLSEQNLIEWREDRIRLTDRGFEVADGVAGALL